MAAVLTVDRLGVTIPLDGVPGPAQAGVARELERLGYRGLWSSEAMASDGFTPLAVAATSTRVARLGLAVAPVFTRGPALLAQSAATLATLAPGRFTLGIGSSSQTLVEGWNATPFDRPYTRVRDTLRFLRLAFTGQRVDVELDSFQVVGFRLGVVPATPPPVLVGALRPRMLELAATEADGVVLNWLSATDAKRVAEIVRRTDPDKEIVARILVAVSTDRAQVRAQARRLIGAYLTAGVYRDYQTWLGRTGLEEMWSLWDAGQRQRAVESIPEEIIDDLVVHGPPDECLARIAAYVENGVTTPVVAFLPWASSPMAAARQLAAVGG